MSTSITHPCSKRGRSHWISKNSCMQQNIVSKKIKTKKKGQNYSKNYLELKTNRCVLMTVTAPVTNIAETSKTRNRKKSHLFFCITNKQYTKLNKIRGRQQHEHNWSYNKITRIEVTSCKQIENNNLPLWSVASHNKPT